MLVAPPFFVASIFLGTFPEKVVVKGVLPHQEKNVAGPF